MPKISDNIKHLRQRIAVLAERCGRNPDHIRLLAVSKTRPPEDIREAVAAGQFAFGENYLQEALDKCAALAYLALEWHFIGPIQSNKTRAIAENFAWAHSVDRLKVAQRLSDQRPAHLPPPNVCIQVNIDGEESKAGVTAADAGHLAEAIAALPGLTLRGLMAIPAPRTGLAAQREPFFRLRRLLDNLSRRCPETLDTLSMGMSDDLEAAIIEGATLVRVGTAIFGERQR